MPCQQKRLGATDAEINHFDRTLRDPDVKSLISAVTIETFTEPSLNIVDGTPAAFVSDCFVIPCAYVKVLAGHPADETGLSRCSILSWLGPPIVYTALPLSSATFLKF